MGEMQRWEKPEATALVLNDSQRNHLSGPISTVLGLQQAIFDFQQSGIDVLIPPKSAIPWGYGVSLSLVVPRESDLYKAPGGDDRCLGKNVLNQLAAAAGVQWDPLMSCRLDNGSDPRYCHYRAAGVITEVDGTSRAFADEKEVDMRPGSAQVSAIFKAASKWFCKNYKPEFGQVSLVEPYPTRDAIRGWRAAVATYNAAAEKKNYKAKLRDPFDQVDEISAHILSHAITKAKNRALRSVLGVPTSAPLKSMRAFLVAKTYFMGDFGDVEMNREAARAITAAAMQAKASLFGNRPLPAPAPVPQSLESHAPPSLGAHLDPDDDWDGPTTARSDPPPPVEPETRQATQSEQAQKPEPSAREQIMDRTRAAAIAKGRWGHGDGQISDSMISSWPDEKIATTLEKLDAMPDKDAEAWGTPNSEPIPF